MRCKNCKHNIKEYPFSDTLEWRHIYFEMHEGTNMMGYSITCQDCGCTKPEPTSDLAGNRHNKEER